MPAFALPSFYDGRIRVNLRGRERDGVVDPADYERVCDDIEQLLRECRDPRTGEPVAGRGGAGGGDPFSISGTDADLVIVWRAGSCAFEHPEHGLIGPVPFLRSGGHTGPYGFAYIADSDLPAGDHGVRSAFDVAPTIVEMVDCPAIDGMSGTSLLQHRARYRLPNRREHPRTKTERLTFTAWPSARHAPTRSSRASTRRAPRRSSCRCRRIPTSRRRDQGDALLPPRALRAAARAVLDVPGLLPRRRRSAGAARGDAELLLRRRRGRHEDERAAHEPAGAGDPARAGQPRDLVLRLSEDPAPLPGRHVDRRLPRRGRRAQ